MAASFENNVWLFPGQGSQEIGMGRVLLERFEPARQVLLLAEELSGLPLGEIIQRGPDQRLAQTNVLQPALVAISLGYVELLRMSGLSPMAVAGHSLGEISALYASGVIGLHDAVRLGVERGRLMHEAAEGGMIAVKDLEPETIESILSQVEGVLVVANYNAPSQTVISGEITALDRAQPLLSHAGGGCVRLNVSGAWHSPLVQQAASKFEESLDQVQFSKPTLPLVMGVTGQQCDDAQEIQAIMKRQIVSPVRWTKVIETFVAMHAERFLEVGPGKVLRGLLRKNINSSISYTVAGIDNSKSVNELLAPVTKDA